MLNYRTYPAVLSTTTLIGAFSLSIALTAIWPDICWLPRVGGLMAGISILMLGYIHVNKERFNIPWRWGLTRDQAYTHLANIFAVFGTLLGVFGDLLPQVLWAPNCACIPAC
jgi:hypothetical protein